MASGEPTGNSRAATVELDGRKVSLTPEGLRSIKGTGAEIAAKLGAALRREVAPE